MDNNNCNGGNKIFSHIFRLREGSINSAAMLSIRHGDFKRYCQALCEHILRYNTRADSRLASSQ